MAQDSVPHVQRVPTIDLDDILSCDTSLRGQTVAALGAGLRELGFVIVEGHAIDPRLIREVYALWQRFFALPEAQKRRYAGSTAGAVGFTPFGVEHARDNPTPDLKEFWHVGQEAPADHPLHGDYPPNSWPEEIPELRQPTLALFRALERVAEQVLVALAESFGLPRETFSAMMQMGNSVLRILHYPEVPEGAGQAVRAAPHEDINLITLLCEATGSGLELLARDGTWLPVEARPGQIVIDAGDMLARVTNGVVPATTHRVINPSAAGNRERFSIPFFVHPCSACDLSVLPQFVAPGESPRFPPVTAGELLAQRLREIGL